MALPDFGDMPAATAAAWEAYERKGDEFLERMYDWFEEFERDALSGPGTLTIFEIGSDMT